MKVPQLNEILARELGRTPYGEPTYQWENSDDLFWPAYATGRMTTKRVEVPLIGGGVDYVDLQIPEYHKAPMSIKLKSQWVITKWCAPEDLTHWEANFPGAGYPARGYRVNTDWFNSRGKIPQEDDTLKFIWAIREQMSKSHQQLMNLLDAEVDNRQSEVDKEIAEVVGEAMPAFANPTPGKRGGSVSLPLARQD